MSDKPLSPLDPLEVAIAATPARILVGRAGPAYRTATALKLREDHAAARDAVHAEVNLARDFGEERIASFGLFETQTQVFSKAEYLRRPDLGRKLNHASRELIRERCPVQPEFQVIVGDGLSATAVAVQAPGLLDRLHAAAMARGWKFGCPFLVRYCRVGVMNDIGDLLTPSVIVLLIGERPGLATAESLSAYMSFQPRAGHTDADRNLISNLHARGISLDEAAARIIALAELFRATGKSGVAVKEVLPAANKLPLV